MQTTDLIQAEVAVIEAGITLAKLNARSVKTRIEEVKALIGSINASASSKVRWIEAQIGAVNEDIEMVEAQVKVFRVEANPAIRKMKEKSSYLRAHIELDNDKLGFTLRELNQIAQDIRYPKFTVADNR